MGTSDNFNKVMSEIGAGSESPDPLSIFARLNEAAPDPSILSDAEKKCVWADLVAWQFMLAFDASEEPWGICWRPLSSGTRVDGTPFYIPDIADVDDTVLSQWITRATSLQEPILVARYADLSWEIGRLLIRYSGRIAIKIPYTLAQLAGDNYVAISQKKSEPEEFDIWKGLDRAITLARALNDQERLSKAKAALFAYHRRVIAERPLNYLWWRLDQIVTAHSDALNLSASEREEVIESLRRVLIRTSDIAMPQTFDPHDAQRAAESLQKYVGNDQAEKQKLVKSGGNAIEQAAKEANGLTAQAMLEPLIATYRNAGLFDDAARIERIIRERAPEANGDFKTISVPLNMTTEERDRWGDVMIGSSLQEGLGRIAYQLMLKEGSTQSSLKDMLESAPLVATMSVAIRGEDGLTAAVLGSVNEDLEGRALEHGATRIGWLAPFLYFAFDRLKQKYSVTVDEILSHLSGSPIFASSDIELLRDGLEAWMAEDSVKAIHILVPQVEVAARTLLIACGASVLRPNTWCGGYKMIGMGEVIRDAKFVSSVPADVTFHLKALYVDPRGINLRNRVAHGIAGRNFLGLGLANWVVHSLLMLAILKPEDKQGAEESSS